MSEAPSNEPLDQFDRPAGPAYWRPSIRKALRIYKYVLMAYTVIFIVVMIVEEYQHSANHVQERWARLLGTFLLFLLVYGIVLTVYYWVIAFVLMFVYRILPVSLQEQLKWKRRKRSL